MWTRPNPLQLQALEGAGAGQGPKPTLGGNLISISQTHSILNAPYSGLNGHARAQQMLRVLAAIQADANRQLLYNFDKMAGGIFRRKQTKQRSRSAWKVFNGPFIIAPECIYMDTHGLVRPHEFELGLFEVCRNPDVIEWNNCKQGLSRLDALADFDRFAANDSADRIEVRSRNSIHGNVCDLDGHAPASPKLRCQERPCGRKEK
jgi:hypothetical protein